MGGTDYRNELYKSYQLGNEQLDEALFREKVEYFRHRVVRFLPQDRAAAIADVACGVGEFLSLAQSLGYTNTIGLDLSDAQLELARRMGVTNVHKESLFDHLAGHPGAYDFILLSHVVEHLTKDELLNCLRLARNALKPGGRVVLLTPNAASPLGFIYAVSDFTHELFLTATSLSQVSAAAGLEAFFIGGATPKSNSLKGRAKALAWAAVRPALAAVYGDRRLKYGRVVEPELIGVFVRSPG